MLQRDFWVTNLQYKVLGIIDHVLHRHADLNDVLVLGQHDLAQSCSTDFGGIDLNHFVNQRRVPLQARRERGVILTKAQHNRALLLVKLIEAHKPPHQQNATQYNA